MFKFRQVSINIGELDKEIGKLTKELAETTDEETYDRIMIKLDKLTELRCKLYGSKIANSTKSVVVSGTLALVSMIIVLKYEDEDVITSKAFNMIPNIFKGSK